MGTSDHLLMTCVCWQITNNLILVDMLTKVMNYDNLQIFTQTSHQKAQANSSSITGSDC